jgi:hypothetical protein
MNNDEARAYLESVWAEVSYTGYTVTVGGTQVGGSIHLFAFAVAFTERRLAAIKKVQNEITWLEDCPCFGNEREQQGAFKRAHVALADLCKGIRAEKLAEMGVEL